MKEMAPSIQQDDQSSDFEPTIFELSPDKLNTIAGGPQIANDGPSGPQIVLIFEPSA